MKSQRTQLAKEAYYMIDDLTPDDLKEKRQHAREVKALYEKGMKLRFYSGKWRNKGGAPYNFQAAEAEVGDSI